MEIIEFLGALIVVLSFAFVPMIFYAAVLWWFDRYEKEPIALIIAAFLWGAVPAIIFSLITQIIFDLPVSAMLGAGVEAELVGASLIAPITEEPFKGLALLLLLVLFRREIDSPLDGILYGGLVGFGFAATENVFYFLSVYSVEGVAGVLGLSIFRALIFGLNHAMFTGLTGLGIALARTSPSWLVKIGAPLLGLLSGTTLHAVHNLGATLAGLFCWPILISLVSDWGGVIALFAIVIWASIREQRMIVQFLADEVEKGAIGQQDYHVIQSYWRRLWQRLQALLQLDFTRWLRLGRYYRLATELAFSKHRWTKFRQEQKTALQIEQLRRDLYEIRKKL
ncbi:MAG: PrsW family intramembrane metalloprotease [Anaerolineae bacterium]|nr:PrsW family intramembrane metalloprotease [Anaerolineae bacterium]